MSARPADYEQRRQALDLERSFCVQAPAGSGKTELLTQRYLALLAHCDRPEEILAITFTRKAAAEMRNRILEQMSRVAAMPETELAGLPEHERFTLDLARRVLARDAEHQWQLTENTARLRISTIDSFNSFLTNQLPVVSELGVMPQILDDARPLFDEAVLDLLAELDGDTPLAAHLARVLAHTNNQWQTLAALLGDLLAKRDQWLANIMDIRAHPEAARPILERTLRALVEDTLDKLARALAPYLGDLLPALQFAAANLEAAGQPALARCDIDDGLPPHRAEDLAQWREVLSVLLTGEFAVRKVVNKRNGFPSAGDAGTAEDKALRKAMKDHMQEVLTALAQDERLPALFETFRYLPAPAYGDEQWQVMQSLVTLLPELVTRLNLVFSRHGQVDHTQVSIAALNALGTDDAPTDLSLRLDYQLRHILVDEFQDTSTLQISLLEKLTQGWQPGDGRTLFIVGDGMQSCYGFRNANVGLFLAAARNGIGQVALTNLQLTANFRSQAGIVDWVNAWFAPAFPPEDDISRGGVRFSPAVAIHDELPDAGVSTVLLAADQDLEEASATLRGREADIVADKIQSLMQRHPGDSIAVLVRTRSHLDRIIPALRARGIAWNATEIDPLDSYPAVQDVLMLTRALLNPADTVAWYALLRSPWLGLPLADIHRLALAAQARQAPLWSILQEFADIPGLSVDARAILSRAVAVLVTARTQRQRLPLREWLEKTWIALGGPAALQSPHYLDSVGHFFNLLQEHDEAGDITDIQRFEDKVKRQYADGLAPEAPVTIMTIHKAKGLEFDHVIIPALERQPRPDDNALLRWREHIDSAGRTALLVSMPAQRGQDLDPTYQHLKYEAALQQRLENTRLFYIGVTRAITSATLIGSVKREAEGLRPPDKNALLAALWPQLSGEPGDRVNIVPVTAADGDTGGNADKTPVMLSRRLPPAWRFPERFRQEPLQEQPSEPPETVHDNLLEREVGEIVHDCLHRAGEKRLALDDPRAMQAMERRWQVRLAPLSDDPARVIAGIHDQLQRCRRHPRFAWMIEQAQQDAASELSLSDYRAGHRFEAVVDRTFIDADGVRWVIDFKSAMPAAGLSREAFLRQQENHYGAQLARYADLFRAMEADRTVKTALFFTALPEFHEIQPDPDYAGANPDIG